MPTKQSLWAFLYGGILHRRLLIHSLRVMIFWKIVILFATSGGSGMGEIYERILPSCKGAKLIEGKVFSSNTSKSELSAWVAGLNI